MTTVEDILAFLETIAPKKMKMDWDNVGLLCGRGTKEVKTVLVALDPFEGVCQEAVQMDADLLLTHHPLIFQPISAVNDQTTVGRAMLQMISHDIAAVNAHTNLDCAFGGVNDTLAAVLGLENVQVVPSGDGDWGLLRQGTVCTQPLDAFLAHVKETLGCRGLRYTDGGRQVSRVAVGGGSCAGALEEVAALGCDTFVTADVKYNQFWDAQDLGVNLIDAGHFYTENPVCRVLAEKLQAAFPEIRVMLSKKHDDCMKFF